MNCSKSISVTWSDESQDSVWRYTLSDSPCVGYKIPRAVVAEDKHREYIEEDPDRGVYILTGIERDSNTRTAYVGESEHLADRLKNHFYKKGFWEYAYVFTTFDGSIEHNHMVHIEDMMYDDVLYAGRYRLYNDRNPRPKKLTDSSKEQANCFLKDIKTLLRGMNSSIFESLDVPKLPDILSVETLILQSAKTGADAKGYKLPDGRFVVYAGSEAVDVSESKAKSISGAAKQLRKQLYKNGVIRKVEKADKEIKYVFMQSCTFESAALAAGVILGRGASASDWKTE